MGKNGGKAPDTILTLEEALRRFACNRSQGGIETTEQTAPATNVLEAGFSATVKHEGDATAGSDLKPADDGASASAQHDEVTAGMPAGNEIVAVLDGIPRTLEQLEQMEAAEKASQAGGVALAARHALIREYAFTAMGAAMMVLAAFSIARVPIVNSQPKLVAQTVAPAMPNASSLPIAADNDNPVTTLVMIPDTSLQLASAKPTLNSGELEARIKDTLKLHAFPDIGVSASKSGEVFLAGGVYGLDEAHEIAQIVHRVHGVYRVHFLHPDVRPADGPAYFGVTTAWAPDVWGAKVQAVFIGSPADKAGITPGDVISEFDGKTIPDAKTFDDLLAHYSPGQRVRFRVWHGGQPEPRYPLARLGEATAMASR
jgi:hypothetical protein